PVWFPGMPPPHAPYTTILNSTNMAPRCNAGAAQAKALADLRAQSGAGPATPAKRTAAQMLGSSPEVGLPVTPTPTRPGSVASSARPRAIRPYREPVVEDAIDEDDVLEGHPLFGVGGLKDQRTALGWKFSPRVPVPEALGPLRAAPRSCCRKCSVTYFNFPDQQCWAPSGMDRCADCLQSNSACEPVDPTHQDALAKVQGYADALLDCRADDEDADLIADSAKTKAALT
ncbi:hypothetical protein V496_10250, partial [Pseudogymnoascus sp. VKM F-4515 (FW-2607)]